MKKWIPEIGEMVYVSNISKEYALKEQVEREFRGMIDGFYCCKIYDEASSRGWIYAVPVTMQDETIIAIAIELMKPFAEIDESVSYSLGKISQHDVLSLREFIEEHENGTHV